MWAFLKNSIPNLSLKMNQDGVPFQTTPILTNCEKRFFGIFIPLKWYSLRLNAEQSEIMNLQ